MAPLARQIESLRALGAQVDVLEVKGISKLKYVRAIPTLYQRVSAVDIVHAHFGYCGWLARTQLSKPLVVSFMGDDLLGTPDEAGRIDLISKLVVQLDRWFAHTADAAIVKSAEMAEVLKPVKTYVVPNGVDMRAFYPMDREKARSKLGWPEGRRYILFPGDPDNPRKQFSLAQAVVKKASRQTREPLELVPLKRVAPTQVPFYMNACEAMIMASYVEGSPNVVKEAMACNLPVVSVPVGDVPELLTGVPGYAVCPRDADALAEALACALNSHQPVEGAVVLKRRGLDLEIVAQVLIGIYEEVLTQKKNQPISLNQSLAKLLSRRCQAPEQFSLDDQEN
jgi:glycosyltransferase involved in cell wall biosynthesis